ncbi:hypothetical protein OCB72_28940 [Bacillus cereus]|nr:hypothetical protein [Bacillus cereus]
MKPMQSESILVDAILEFVINNEITHEEFRKGMQLGEKVIGRAFRQSATIKAQSEKDDPKFKEVNRFYTKDYSKQTEDSSVEGLSENEGTKNVVTFGSIMANSLETLIVKGVLTPEEVEDIFTRE